MSGIDTRFFRRGKIAVSIVLLVVVALALFLGSSIYASHTLPPPTNARVTINAQQTLGRLTDISRGINTAIFDHDLLADSTRTAIENANVGLLRFPGGLDSDLYHWQSHTLLKGAIDPKDTFDAFMSVAQAVKTQTMITVDYGAGTATEAAGWVQYANKGGPNYTGPVPTYSGGSPTGHTYGVKYWEIGNENYGDGTYGITWEYNTHGTGPLIYARKVVEFSQAMKAVDPTIKIGAVLTAPGNWPDGDTSPPSRRPWNQTVLSTACSSIDFVIAHWYAQNPGNESDATLLASTSRIAGMVSTLRDELRQICGSHASAIQIMVTETNSVSYNPGKQIIGHVNALFLADNYMTWLEQGAANVDWWDLHDQAFSMFNNDSSLHGEAHYGDYGLLANATCSGSFCEPTLNTPFPPYYALQMLGYLGQPGDTMVAAVSSHPLIAVHAVKQANGNLALILINKDASTSSTVSLVLQGYTSAASARVYSYGEQDLAIRSQAGSSLQVKLAPYSLTTVILSPALI